MRTRLVQVRRRQPMQVKWALALTIVALLGYLSMRLPTARQTTPPDVAAPLPTAKPASASAERVTEDVRLEAIELYAIQLGAYDDQDSAKAEAARYVRRGAAGYICKDGTNRVLGAGYLTRAEAEAVVKRLKDDEDIDAEVYITSTDSVLLRVTATTEQVEALKSAEQALRDGAEQLNQLSFSLDKGTTALEDAAKNVKALAATVLAKRDALAAQAGETPNTVASGLIDLLTGFWQGLTDSTSGEQTLMDFSSKLKYNYLDVQLRHVTFLRGLSG